MILKHLKFENIYSSTITINENDHEQADLVEYISNFNNKARCKNRNDKKYLKNIFDTAKNFHERRELVINVFKSGLFPLKSITGTGIKILTAKKMLQRLPIALARVDSGDNSENLSNESEK